jgi:hypothetical protein
MIKYEVRDTEFPNLKSALIYSEEDIHDLFADISIYNANTKNQWTRVTIQVPEKFIRDISKTTGIQALDLVEQGVSPPGYEKHLTLNLDSNIELIHTKRK